MKFFNFLKSLFVKTPTVEEVSSTVVTDALGNALQVGDPVVDVLYNELGRRGYLTVKSTYQHYHLTDIESLKHDVIKYDALLDLIANDHVHTGKRTGFLHVTTA